MRRIFYVSSLSLGLMTSTLACGDAGPSADAGSAADAGFMADAGRPDLGTPDTGAPDTGTPDSGAPDSGTPDSGAPDTGPTSVLTQTEQDFFRTTTPLAAEPPADSTNRYAASSTAGAAAAIIGQKWFFDRRFSGPVGAAGQGQISPAPTDPPAAVVAAVGPKGTTGLVACASCHSFENGAFGDDRKSPNHVSLGTGVHPRNAPPVVNSAYYEVTNWAGRFAAQWELPLPVSENPRIMNGSRMYLAQQIWKNYKDEYKATFQEYEHGTDGGDALMDAIKLKIAAFNAAQNPVIAGDELSGATISRGKPKANAAAPDGLWETLSAGERAFVNRVATNFGKALAAYQRKLVRRETPFDAWAAGGFVGAEIPLTAQRGAKVFIKAGCDKCHKGTMFTDSLFHNTGLTQLNPLDQPPTEGVGATPADGSDAGRFADGDALAKANGGGGATPGISVDTKWSDDRVRGAALIAQFNAITPMPDSARGSFRTPSLRGVKDTAPYMHAGQLKTLAEVVDFYARGGDASGFAGTKDPLIVPVTLTAEEKTDLVSFLEQLSATDALPATLIMDTSGQ